MFDDFEEVQPLTPAQVGAYLNPLEIKVKAMELFKRHDQANLLIRKLNNQLTSKKIFYFDHTEFVNGVISDVLDRLDLAGWNVIYQSSDYGSCNFVLTPRT